MPVYGSALGAGGVRSLIGNRPLDANSVPSQADVEAWLDQAEAELLGAIAAGGGPASYTGGSVGALTIAKWVNGHVAGLVRESNAAAGGDGTNEDGETQYDRWIQLLDRLRSNASNVIASLDGGSLPANAVAIGSHATDATLALSEADVAPTFRIARGSGNF